MVKKKWMAGILAATMLIACVCPTEIVMAEENSTGVESESQVTDQAEANGDFEIENGKLTKYTGKGGDVVIPKGVTRIGNDAFRNCEKLKSISIPESVTYVKIPSGVKSLEAGVFFRCSNLTGIDIPSSVKKMGYGVFRQCNRQLVITCKSGSYAEQYAKDNGIKYNYSQNSAGIPDKGKVLKSGKTTYTVTKKGKEAAYTKTASQASDITVPETVTIDHISYKVTSISSDAFKNNKKLKKVTIGKNVTTIGNGAFRGCGKMETVKIRSSKLKSVGKNAFKGIKSNAKIKVPAKKLKAYKKLLKGSGLSNKAKITK